MKKLFIIGNWKSYKTTVETKDWFQQILHLKSEILESENKEIILCVPFTVLSLAKSLIQQYNLPIKLGAQDISPFDEGKYTGEINGKQIKEFAEYVIIGHSERRRYFGETDELLEKKVSMAKQYGIIPLFCVEGSDIVVPQGVDIVIYEPITAIGTGNPDTPENADSVCKAISDKHHNAFSLYGGSVTSENVHSFTSMSSISGVLPGGASLIPDEFAKIIRNA